MINGKKVIAIIPARIGSRGIKFKNIRMLNGKPLIYWTIKCALASRYVDKVIVSTDSKQIADLSKKYGADVPFIRPKSLSSDSAKSVDVIIHCLASITDRFNYVILCEPTSPLRTVEDVDNALEILSKSKSAKALVSVCRHEGTSPEFAMNIYKGFIKPYSKVLKHTRRQDIKPSFYPEGSLYISDIGTLINSKTFYHSKTLAYEVPRWKSFEIDEEMDLYIVEAILKWRNKEAIKESYHEN